MHTLAALPKEIFQCIANYLSKQDMVECQCVCSEWYRKWIQFIYHHVHIRGKLQFQAFFCNALQTSLMTAPFSTGYQIRKLVVENGHIEPSVLGQLPQLCPSLEVFIFDGAVLSQAARKESIQYYQQRRNREELDKVQHYFTRWKYMRELVELNGITVAHAFLQQKSSNLTSLSVQFNNQNDRTNSKRSLIDSLHHAPNLQLLSIERIYLTVEELELVHDKCPKLASFYLSDVVLLPMSAVQQCGKENVQPALHLKKLHIVNGSFCDDVSRWLDYISRKYVRARRLEIGSCSFFAGADEDSTMQQQKPQDHDRVNASYESQLLLIAKHYTKLETLKMQSFCLQNSFFQLLDRNAICLSELTLGDGLTSSLACELDGLLRSQQRNYIKTLTVLSWPLAIDIRGLHIIMSSLGQCVNITTLNLSLGRHLYRNNSATSSPTIVDNATIYLDILLQKCSRLTCLTLTDGKLSVTANTTLAVPSHFHRYTLQSLGLENMLIDNDCDVFGFIAINCTKLINLSLVSTVSSPLYHNTRNFNIYLPQHALKTLVLDRIRVSRKCSVRLGASRFKIIKDTKAIWYDLVGYECCNNRFYSYTTTNNDTSMSMDNMRAKKVQKVQDSDISYTCLDQSVYVSVVCKSIESLFLTGLHVTL